MDDRVRSTASRMQMPLYRNGTNGWSRARWLLAGTPRPDSTRLQITNLGSVSAAILDQCTGHGRVAHSRFGMENGFAVATELLPLPVGSEPLAEHCSPFGPVPLQNLPPYYELLRPCAPHRYSGPCGFCHLDVSLGSGTTGSHVPYKSLIRLRAAYMPDVARAVFRTAPELIPEAGRPSGFDITFGISTRHQRFAFARLSGSYLTGLRSRLWLQRSPRSLLTTAACRGLRPAPDCRPRGANPHLLYSSTSPPSEMCS